MAVYLGIDLGTSGLKSLLVREDGVLLGSGYREYPIHIPFPGGAEQDPEDWWRALRASLAEAMRKSGVQAREIAGIGLSGQMHGTVLTGADGHVLRPAVIWCDQRSAKQARRVREQLGDETLGRWVQNPVAAGFQLCTLLWLREHEAAVFARAHRALLPKDHLRWRLTGETGTEPSDACSTLMFDCAGQDWSEPLLDRLKLDRALLPDARHEAMQIQGTLTRGAAAELGLREGIPVVFGGGDQPMQALAHGILCPGDASITLGTGGQIFAPIDRPAYDPQLRTHTFCHAQRSSWYVMGAILNCCLAQNWFFHKVLDSRAYADLHAAAAQVPAGSDGLYFLPYLTGERTPHMDPEARGAFVGLTLGHDRAVLTRAVIEGICFALREAMDCVQSLNPHIRRLVLSGGGARSPLWRQVLADMLDMPLYAAPAAEEAGLGAAICAMVGTGAYDSLAQACEALVPRADVCAEPIPANVEFYREHRKTFQALYEGMQPLLRR